MNKSDSERIASIFEQYNCTSTDNWKDADFIIMNTCSIKQSAENRVMGQVNNFNKYKKKQKPDLKIVITGCMVFRTDAVAKTKGVDVAININDLALLPEKLNLTNDKQIEKAKDYFSITPKYKNNFQVFIPIMTGCNNFCTFCVVPYTRGREYSRPMIDVLNEVKLAVNNGAKEIYLLGQNVNSYEFGFEELLRKINSIEGEFWVRFVSANPQDMSKELIDVIATSEKLCKYIHFAVQSGNDRILKKMNRRHTIEDYLKLYDKMKKVMPEMGISTDIIVGFPSETEEEFKDTIKLMEQVKFDMAYISQYSARTGTPAWRLDDDVSIEEKKRRDKIATEILAITAKKNGEKLIGKSVTVLIEKLNRRGQLTGKETGYRTVNIINSSDESLIGTFVDVKITNAHNFGLDAEII